MKKYIKPLLEITNIVLNESVALSGNLPHINQYENTGTPVTWESFFEE